MIAFRLFRALQKDKEKGVQPASPRLHPRKAGRLGAGGFDRLWIRRAPHDNVPARIRFFLRRRHGVAGTKAARGTLLPQSRAVVRHGNV